MFKIILNHPHIDDKKSLREYESIGELIENIFPLSEDYFYINWNATNVSLSYRYDLSIIFEDFVYIYDFLESQENVLEIAFPSNTFDVMWNMKKDDNSINITSIWNTVLSHNEKILNKNSYLNIDLSFFKEELSKLLKFIYEIIIKKKDNINKQLFNDILVNKPNNLIL